MSVETESFAVLTIYARMHFVFRKRPEDVKISERQLSALELKVIYTVKEKCRVLIISESGYYHWLKNAVKLADIRFFWSEKIFLQHIKTTTKLLTDITEVQCSNEKLYVSPVMDCLNGKIVALEIRDNNIRKL